MHHNRKLLILPLILIVALASFGCAAKQNTAPAHPNQLSQFDGYAYDTLITIQAALNQVKTEVLGFPQYKPQVNQAIAAYNVAQAAYKTYHTSAATNPTTEPQAQANLQAQLTDLAGQIAMLEKAFGVTPAEVKP